MSESSIGFPFKTVIFYLLAVLLIWLANRWSPSGPCTPGLGALFLCISFIVSICLLVVTGTLALMGYKSHRIPAIIHAVVLTMFFLSSR